MQKIDNIANYTRFYIGFIAFTLCGVIPLFFGIDSLIIAYLPYFTVGISIAAIAVVRPAYFYLSIREGNLSIQSSLSGDDSIHISKHEYAGYQLNTHLKGWRNDLIIFRKSERGFMQSRTIRVSLLTREQQNQLVKLLEELKA